MESQGSDMSIDAKQFLEVEVWNGQDYHYIQTILKVENVFFNSEKIFCKVTALNSGHSRAYVVRL